MAESHGATKSINVKSIDLTREKPIKTVEMLNGEKISKKIFAQLCLTLTYFVGGYGNCILDMKHNKRESSPVNILS